MEAIRRDDFEILCGHRCLFSSAYRGGWNVMITSVFKSKHRTVTTDSLSRTESSIQLRLDNLANKNHPFRRRKNNTSERSEEHFIKTKSTNPLESSWSVSKPNETFQTNR